VLTFRIATRADVPAVLELLADDEVSRARDAAVADAAVPQAAGAAVPQAAGAAVPQAAGAAVPQAAGAAVPQAADAAANRRREAIEAAFDAIDADPRNELIVADDDGRVVGTFQLTFTPSLSRGGRERMTIEGVRVSRDLRGRGVGRSMMEWALARGRERGCGIAQLTTDKRRTDAHRFYASLGFAATHEGMKLSL
jgi:GNAT superfamily N-acetyltransferase